MRRAYVIIPAAGKSVRMGGDIPKILLDVDGIPVVVRTMLAFEKYEVPGIDIRIVVVTGASLIDTIKELAREHSITRLEGVVEGGATRTDSVYNGIMFVKSAGASDDDLVFVHDGARCLVDDDTIANCFKGMESHDIVAAAVPVKSTIKTVRKTGDECQVVDTPDREALMEIQTPQCFRFGKILECYSYAIDNNIPATDDTSLAEITGNDVFLVMGAYTNIKLTTPEDMDIAKAFISRRKN